MQHAISPVAADTARHLVTLDSRERRHAEHDRRQDLIRDQLEAGDWESVEEFISHAPLAQRREFYTQCGAQLLGLDARLMRGRIGLLAQPLQEAVALGVAERVDRELAAEAELASHEPWRDQA